MSTIPENHTLKKSNQKQKFKNNLNNEDLIIKYINELKDEDKRTKAIAKLSEYYDKNYNLPVYLWYSQGTMAILLQEIISSYKYLSSSKLTPEMTSKICNILCLFTCIASHNEIKYKFIESKIPIFLYPFLNNTSTAKFNEYIKLVTLTVISTLIKTEDPKIISFFIHTEITPILFKIIDIGPNISKIPACIMIHIIIKADEGLKYICEEKVRYSAIIIFLRHMLNNKHNQTIINTTLKIFIRLAENIDARNLLKNNILKEIKDQKFTRHLNDSSKTLLNCLIKILNTKDEGNKIKENQKEINKNNSNNNNANMSVINDGIKNNNNNNSNVNNNNNQQININNGDLMNQYNMNNNMMIVNQLNQMKLSPQPYMNYNDINNYKMFNGNDSYINKINYMGNQNNNKGFVNINYYNMYKSN